jgi:large subunit ribosomal protein L30
MALKLRIRQIRSTSGRKENQRLTLRALGIRRIDHTVEHADTPQIRGMIFKIRHLVEVDEIRDK